MTGDRQKEARVIIVEDCARCPFNLMCPEVRLACDHCGYSYGISADCPLQKVTAESYFDEERDEYFLRIVQIGEGEQRCL